MNFLKYDLGNCERGEIVEITLSRGANVRLLTGTEFSNYRNGRRHRFIGGLATKSPVRLQITHSGHWYVVVDMQGLRGTTSASVRKLPGMLPKISEVPLSDVPGLVRDFQSDAEGETYDVFVSHASEDKDSIVRSLATELRLAGLSVWYDEFSLRIGDSLRQKIDTGLSRSRVGLVILSPSFMSKGWTNYELDGIVTRAISGEQLLLPIWHNVTKDQVIKFSPSLADKVARSTAVHTVKEIASEIADLLASGNQT